MQLLNNLKKHKTNLENYVANTPIMRAYWRMFIVSNLVLGVTSGILNQAFYYILKIDEFKHIKFWYMVRISFYFWVVFVAGFSLILMFKRLTELPRWAAASVWAYIAISFACLAWLENFMPFELVGSGIFNLIYHNVRHMK